MELSLRMGRSVNFSFLRWLLGALLVAAGLYKLATLGQWIPVLLSHGLPSPPAALLAARVLASLEIVFGVLLVTGWHGRLALGLAAALALLFALVAIGDLAAGRPVGLPGLVAWPGLALAPGWLLLEAGALLALLALLAAAGLVAAARRRRRQNRDRRGRPAFRRRRPAPGALPRAGGTGSAAGEPQRQGRRAGGAGSAGSGKAAMDLAAGGRGGRAGGPGRRKNPARRRGCRPSAVGPAGVPRHRLPALLRAFRALRRNAAHQRRLRRPAGGRRARHQRAGAAQLHPAGAALLSPLHPARPAAGLAALGELQTPSLLLVDRDQNVRFAARLTSDDAGQEAVYTQLLGQIDKFSG